MTDTSIGLAGIAVLFLLLAFRIPVAFAMFVVGFIGIWLLNGWNAAMGLLASETFTLASKPELIVVPLFILMGNVASVTGMSRQLYEAAYAFIGHIRGGLASATVIGCGGFAALSGSSVASALTMGKVSLAEMDRYKYDPKLSTGVVAAGGTLGILIPPSTGFVIYAILTEQSIGRLFLAGVLPGLLLLSVFVLTVTLLCTWRPELGPRGPRTTLAEKRRALAGALPILSVIVLTIGGIYGGFFSPNEAAARGRGARGSLRHRHPHAGVLGLLERRSGQHRDHRHRDADPDRRAPPQPVPRAEPCAARWSAKGSPRSTSRSSARSRSSSSST